MWELSDRAEGGKKKRLPRRHSTANESFGALEAMNGGEVIEIRTPRPARGLEPTEKCMPKGTRSPNKKEEALD